MGEAKNMLWLRNAKMEKNIIKLLLSSKKIHAGLLMRVSVPEPKEGLELKYEEIIDRKLIERFFLTKKCILPKQVIHH